MRQHKFCPHKQQDNNTIPFLIYAVAVEEAKNYYECFKYGVWTWNKYLMI